MTRPPCSGSEPVIHHIDLGTVLRGAVCSLYSNLVTRPTGAAVRGEIERAVAEVGARTVTVVDFSQVTLLDYSCADEIVAKLLLRYLAADRPMEVYFVARGLQDHHRDAVCEVLERHRLLLVTLNQDMTSGLLGACNPFERACWSALAARTCATVAEVAEDTALPEMAVEPTLARLLAQRVLVSLPTGQVCELSTLARGR